MMQHRLQLQITHFQDFLKHLTTKRNAQRYFEESQFRNLNSRLALYWKEVGNDHVTG
jgi:hypothetical protein